MLYGLTLFLLTDWATTLSLVFGGCCSNALTLERVTSEYPNSGTLITFSQFFLISLHGLPKFLTFGRGPLGIPVPWLKPRRIPLTPYLTQVVLFYFISSLNNAAFAYKIPMPVHIIFRSGGLVISMIMGWLISRRRYTITQVVSVLLVTFGVILTTLSASHPHESPSTAPTTTPQTSSKSPLRLYMTGISLLTLALILSGFLGIVQDKTYSHYGKQIPESSSAKPAEERPYMSPNGSYSAVSKEVEKIESNNNLPDAWQESMFYLHFLSLPIFFFVRDDLMTQAQALLSSRKQYIPLPAYFADFLPLSNSQASLKHTPLGPTLAFPSALLPLFLNTLTQLFCVAGVNRLTTRVAALTVTLVLVVRKAVSLVLSVVLFRGNTVMDARAWMMLWGGAALVFAGTVGYTVSVKGKGRQNSATKKKEE